MDSTVEFRANPGYYLVNDWVPAEMGPDGRFNNSGWRGVTGDNQFLTNPGQDRAGQALMISGPANFTLTLSPSQPIQTSLPERIQVRTLNPSQFSSVFGSMESFRTHPHKELDDPISTGSPIIFSIGGPSWIWVGAHLPPPLCLVDMVSSSRSV